MKMSLVLFSRHFFKVIRTYPETVCSFSSLGVCVKRLILLLLAGITACDLNAAVLEFRTLNLPSGRARENQGIDDIPVSTHASPAAFGRRTGDLFITFHAVGLITKSFTFQLNKFQGGLS